MTSNAEAESREESLERWRYAMERRKSKGSRSEIDYTCVNERTTAGKENMQG